MTGGPLARVLLAAVVLAAVGFGGLSLMRSVRDAPPGDYATRQGDLRLGERRFAAAIAAFDRALAEAPGHRGARLGKAAALIGLARYAEAETLLTATIADLTAGLAPDDPTGRAALAAAFANRGILRDRQGRHAEALEDYLDSIRADRDIAGGPGWIERLLHHSDRPSSVLDRARYLYREFQKPESERLLRVPELDARQRMYKP